MEWVSLIVAILIGALLIGSGVVARSASKGGAILIIIAGVFELLTACCLRGLAMAAPQGTYDEQAGIMLATMLGGTCVDLLVVVLVIAGLVTIAKAVRRGPGDVHAA